MGRYDVAQICTNGHLITDSLRRSPQFAQKFCKTCGAATISQCPSCKSDIQGEYQVEGLIDLTTMSTPGFCHNCGRPFPWTAARIETAKAIADEISELDENEKLLLKASIDDIIGNTPRTELGILRFKKYAAKAGRATGQGLRDVLVEVVSETVKKSIWGG